MSTISINTSKAANAMVELSEFDKILIAMQVFEGGQPVDLDQYKITFHLKIEGIRRKFYTINKGESSAEFLSKVGHTLNTQLMFTDVRNVIKNGTCKLIMEVERPDNLNFVYLVITVNVKQY